jgi:hypothetical protein
MEASSGVNLPDNIREDEIVVDTANATEELRANNNTIQDSPSTVLEPYIPTEEVIHLQILLHLI